MTTQREMPETAHLNHTYDNPYDTYDTYDDPYDPYEKQKASTVHDPAVAPDDLPTLLAHRADLAPDALALVGGGTTLTYRQLVSAAQALAAHLQDQGVRPGDCVALLTRRSARTVVAQLALWWAGAVCVPLDPAHPSARTEAIVADSGAVLTVGDAELMETAGVSGRRVELSGDAPAARPHEGSVPLAVPGPDATAFIMFTSGSTGRPKGVAVRHGAVAALVTDPEYVTVTARDRVLLHSPATFDASTFEVWVALANGAAVVVCPADRPSFEDLVREVERHSVTVAFFTTALFHQLAARRSRVFALLRSVVVGGEALSVQHARSVLREFPWLELVNGYGPTETTTFATAHRVTAADAEGPMPVGRPIAGATAHVLDEDRRAVAPGEQGELWIGGTRLARGYVGRPDLTAERFVAHPALGRLYRTGDLASARPDGVLDYHGRTDDQVKVRGHRIEPGEIEHVLRNQPEVADAAVTVRRPTPDDARLAAFVVCRTSAGAAAESSTPAAEANVLRTRLAGLLPAHLVPDEVTVVKQLPLTPSGKVDRQALAALTPPVPARAEHHADALPSPDPHTAASAAPAPAGAVTSHPGPDAAPNSAAGPDGHPDADPDGPTDAGPDGRSDADSDGPIDAASTPTQAGHDARTPAPSPTPSASADDSRPDAPALTPLQQVVAEVWARSLMCEVASPDDDFLALGGHSLLALVVTDDLREDLGVELSLADFFASPTVAGHAALVERALLAAHTDLHPLPLPLTLPHPEAPEHTDVP